jgi:Uncharacterized conserved protein
MKKPLTLKTFQVTAPRRRGEGLRIGATRRSPRGVPRARWTRDGYFDVWFPIVAPSATLLRRASRRDGEEPAVRRRFFRAYERELSKPPARHAVGLLAALARRTPISIGCYCSDESACHRSVLKKVIEREALKARIG